jgi:hypothetical protein
MFARNAGVDSRFPSAVEPSRRTSSGEPTLEAQGMAVPRDLVMRGLPVRTKPVAVEATAAMAIPAARPALSALAAGASLLR